MTTISTAPAARSVRTYDPYEYIVKKNAPTWTHNLSIAGSKGSTNFNISLGYLDQSGMMKTTDYDWYKRYNANVRVSTQINDFVNVHAGMMYTNSTKSWAFATNSTTADVWYYLYRWGPTYPLVAKDEYGNNVRTMAYETATANQATIKKSYASVNAGTTSLRSRTGTSTLTTHTPTTIHRRPTQVSPTGQATPSRYGTISKTSPAPTSSQCSTRQP